MAVVIETTMGCLTVDLFVKERPNTCTNFLKLCKMKYYNFCLFHSVQNNFIAQTGDPTGTGNGGESIFGMVHGEKAKYYEAEVMPRIKHSRAGLISMVNCGNNMLGSQFFFTLGEDLNSLDGEHCVFGEVADGMDVLIQLNEVICDEEHHPFRDIRITHTVILEDPFDDLPNLTFPDHSPEPTKERLMNGRIAPDEEVDDTKGKTLEEVEEMVQKREAQARATILEIVGDIPDAEIAPPENILFVCKLNPITTDEELEILFARFGTIKSCEVIKDKKTGDSLQYAFIEFEDKDACETAYLTMDNVLIDDRRIHVDFSQSVAKMRWRGKGKGVEYLTDDKQKDLQRRISKDGNGGKVETRERKRRSRSLDRHKWRNQSERENWEKYQERKDKGRDDSGRRYKKSGDCSRSRISEVKGHDYRGQRNPERVRDGRDWSDHGYNWDKRMRNEGRENLFYGRNHISERQMEAEMSKGGRERRNRGSDRSERRDVDLVERHRSSKESLSKSEKRMEDCERLGARSERSMREEMEGRNIHGEFSRYEEGKSDRMTYKQKRHFDKHQKHDMDSFKYGPEISSENEERMGYRSKKRRYEDDRERIADMGERYGRKGNQSSRGDEYRTHNYARSASDEQTISRISGRDNISKERGREQRNTNDVDSDGSVKYELSQSSKHTIKDGRGSTTTKKMTDKKASKHTSSDGLRRSRSSEKVKKDHGGKGRKVLQKRKRYSTSSSCCSDSSCSCGSSCCSSSSDSDDSDCESNSELSESCSSSSTSPDRKTKSKKKRNKKKLLMEMKKGKKRRSGHKKRQRSSSESSENSLDEDTKGKHKNRRKKVDGSSSSDHKGRNANHSRGQKIKKNRKSSKKRKDDSSESSSEESSSSSDSVIQRKSCNSKRKKGKKEILPGKKGKAKKKSIKHKGKKGSALVSTKKKKKRNDSSSSDSSDSSDSSESDSSSKEEVKQKKELQIKDKGIETVRGR